MKKMMVAVLAAYMMLLSACTLTINGNETKFDLGIGPETRQEDETKVSASGASALELRNNAGNIAIEKGDGKDITIRTIKRVRGSSDKKKKEILDNVKVTAEKKGESIIVRAVTVNGRETDIWDWVDKEYRNVRLSIDFIIEVPDGIEKFKVDSNAGNIEIDDIKGEFDFKLNAGNIEMDDVALTGNSRIDLKAGNAELDCDIAEADKLTIRNTAGNIMLSLPSDAEFTLDAGVTAGMIGGSHLSGIKAGIGGSVRTDINGGGTIIDIEATAGNITINKS